MERRAMNTCKKMDAELEYEEEEGMQAVDFEDGKDCVREF